MNKFARLISALVAIFGRKTTVTAAPVKYIPAPKKDGGASILRLAAENGRLKRELGAENALLKERIAALEDQNHWLALWMEENRMLAIEAMRLLDEAEAVGYKDVRAEANDGDVFIRVPTNEPVGTSTMYYGNLVEDMDGDYSHWDKIPLYGFKSVKTARYHCRGCRRVEKARGHRCGKK